MSSTNPSQLFIRPARRSDSGALSRICLLTGDAGASAEDVHLPFAGGFVLVDPSKKSIVTNNFESNDNHDADEGKGGEDEDEGSVVGYILSAFDTIQFEKAMEEEWLPKYRSKYPLSITSPDSPGYTSSPPPKDADIRFIKTIHDPHHAHPAALAYSPAHMHIDILAEYQRLGYGKKLIGVLVKWLKEEKGLDRMWLGMDTRNVGARRFYERLGFREIVGAPLGVVGIEFQDWKD